MTESIETDDTVRNHHCYVQYDDRGVSQQLKLPEQAERGERRQTYIYGAFPPATFLAVGTMLWEQEQLCG